MYDIYLFFVIFWMLSLIYYWSLIFYKDYWCWFWEKFDKFSDVFLWNVIYYGNGFKYKDIELFISDKL